MFELRFVPAALKEWDQLDKATQRQFQKKLEKLIIAPRVLSMKLREYGDCYRVMARKAGYRVIYHVSDRYVTITVIRVARRDKDEAYEKLLGRLAELELP